MFIIPLLGISQEIKVDKKIKFDFLNPESIRIPKDLKEGDFYRIEVTSLNLNKYAVNLDIENKVLETALELPVPGNIQLGNVVDWVSSKLASLPAVQTESEPMDTSIEDSKNKSGTGVISINDIIEIDILQEIKDDISSVQENNVLFLEALYSDLNAINYQGYNLVKYRLLKLSNPQNAVHLKIEDELKAYDQINTNLKLLVSFVQKAINTNNEETNKYAEILDKKGNETLKNNWVKGGKLLSETLKKITKTQSLINAKNIEKSLLSVLYLDTTNTYLSLPIQFNKDQATVNMSFIPKDTNSGLQTYYLPEIELPKRSIYFGVGTSLYYSPLSDERISTETIQLNDTVSRYTVSRDRDLKGEIGVAAMLYVGHKFADLPIGIHGALGTGVSTSKDVKVRLLSSVGLSLGHKNSFTINVGCIGGNVDRISKNIEFDKEYVEVPNTLVKDLKLKVFYSLGYLFKL